MAACSWAVIVLPNLWDWCRRECRDRRLCLSRRAGLVDRWARWRGRRIGMELRRVVCFYLDSTIGRAALSKQNLWR